MATVCSNYWKYSKLNLFLAKVFKIFLMMPGFTFNIATHKLYADVSTYEIATAGGYTKGTGITLSGIAVSQDDTDNRGLITWSDVSFTPSGASLSICGAVLIDTTDNIIVGFLDAGGTVVMTDGQPYAITNISCEED